MVYYFAWAVIISVYMAISVFAAYMTGREHQRNGQKSLVMSVASYLLCLVWPLAAAGMLFFARWRPAEFVPADRD